MYKEQRVCLNVLVKGKDYVVMYCYSECWSYVVSRR